MSVKGSGCRVFEIWIRGRGRGLGVSGFRVWVFKVRSFRGFTHVGSKMEAYHQVGRISAHCHVQGQSSEYSPLEKCNYRLLLRSIAVHNAAHNAACIPASRIAALHCVMHAIFEDKDGDGCRRLSVESCRNTLRISLGFRKMHLDPVCRVTPHYTAAHASMPVAECNQCTCLSVYMG